MKKSLPNPALAGKKLLTISQAAKHLGVSIDTVRRWNKSGKIASLRTAGQARRFTKEMLDAAKNGKQNPVSPQGLTVSEAAKRLGVTTMTIRRWDKAGKIKVFRDKANYRRIAAAEIDQLLTKETAGKEKSHGEVPLTSPTCLPDRQALSPLVPGPSADGREIARRLAKALLFAGIGAFLIATMTFAQQQNITKGISYGLISLIRGDKNIQQVIKELAKGTYRNLEEIKDQKVLGQENLELSNNELRITNYGLNLLKNPSFETVKGQQAAFWQYHPNSTQNNTFVSELTPHSGSKTLMLHDTGCDGGKDKDAGLQSGILIPALCSMGVIQEATKTESNRSYELGVWVKALQPVNSYPLSVNRETQIHLALGPGYDRSFTINRDNQWHYYSTRFETPPPGLVPRIYAINLQAEDFLFLDDGYFGEIIPNNSSQIANNTNNTNNELRITNYGSIISGFNTLIPTAGGVLSVTAQGILYPTNASETAGGLGLSSQRFGKFYGSEADLSQSLVVNENANVKGALTADGAVNLGDASGDDINVKGHLISDLTPKTDGNYSLGTNDLRWKNGFVDDMAITNTLSVGGAITISGGTSITGDLTLNGDLDFTGAQNITTTADNLTISPAGNLIIDTSGETIAIRDANIDLTAQPTTISGNTLTIKSTGTFILDTSANNTNLVLQGGTGGLIGDYGTISLTAAADQIGALQLLAGRGGITLSTSQASSNGVMYLKSAGTLQLDTSAKNSNILFRTGTGQISLSANNTNIGDGGSTNYISISATGDLTLNGTANNISANNDLVIKSGNSLTLDTSASNSNLIIKTGSGTLSGSTGAVNLSASGLLTLTSGGNFGLYSSGELYFDDQWTASGIPFSQSGQTGLSSALASASIVGAINEMATGQTGIWIDSNGGTAGGNITFKDQTVNWDTDTSGTINLDTTNTFTIGSSNDSTTALTLKAVSGGITISSSSADNGELRLLSGGTLTLDTSRFGAPIYLQGGLARVGSGGTANYADGAGDLYIQNDLEVDGNVYLGSSTASNLTVTGYVISDLTPNPGSQYNLGSSARKWSNVWADTVTATNIAGTVVSGATSSSDWTINTSNGTADLQDSTLTFERGIPAVNSQFKWNSTNKQLTSNASFGVYPDTGISNSAPDTAIFEVNDPYGGKRLLLLSENGTDKMAVDSSGNILLFQGSNIETSSGALTLKGYNGLTLTTSSASTGEIRVLARGTLQLDTSGTNNNILILPGSGKIGVGTANPVALLDIEGAITGQALVQLNETGDQDIFTASKSGAPRLTITRDGNIKLHQTSTIYTIAGDLQLQTSSGRNDNIVIRTYDAAASTANGDDIFIAAQDNLYLGASTMTLETTSGSTGQLVIRSDGTLQLDTSANNNNILVRAGTGSLNISAATLKLTGNLDITGTETFNGITYTFPGSQSASGVLTTNGSGSLGWGTLGASSITADSLDFTEFKDEMTLDADTSINGDYSLIVRTGLGSIQNSSSGNNDLQLSAEDKLILAANSFDLLTSSGAIDLISGSYLDLSSQGTLTLDTSQNNSNILMRTGSGNINVSTGTLTMTGILDVRNSTGTLALATDANGNVGIGTTGPGDKLDINSGNILIDYGYYLGVSASDRFFIDGTDGASMVSSVNPYVIMDSDNNATTNYFSILKDAQTRSTATELFRVQENGNVGIGTTGPLGILDVLGSCVTGDTRLRRRRRRKGKKSQEEIDLIDLIDLISKKAPSTNDQKRIKELAVKLGFGKLDIGHSLGQLEIRAIRNFAVDQLEQLEIRNSDFEDVRIDQIQEGDEILTLDENSGKFVVQKVEKVMEKGIQAVFRLITESGKQIKTTSEHPYLTLEDDKKAPVSRSFFDSNSPLGGHRTYREAVYQACQKLSSFKKWTGGESNPRSRNDKSISPTRARPTSSFYQKPSWKKVSLLKPGILIATIDGWERIKSIIMIGRKQVYDLAVEGTHNFVAGHYVNRRTRRALTPEQEEKVYRERIDLIDLIDLISKQSPSSNDQKEISRLSKKLGIGKLDIGACLGQLEQLEIRNSQNFSFGGIVAHNTSGILMRAGASSLQLSSSAASTTADIELAAADQMDLFAGRFSLTTSSLTGGVMNLSSTGTMTLTTSQTNANILLLPGTGNVGVGTTAPAAFFQIGSGATPSFVATSAGNIGIGTTSPLGIFDVLGSCVTGDTLLPIRRRRRKKKKAAGDEDDYDDLLIPIKDVRRGDLVASLDESSGKIVYRPIKQLMPIGIKPVYKLTTAGGRLIETTANHPYLVEGRGWTKVSQIKVGAKIAVPAGISRFTTYAFVDASNMIYRDTDKNPWKIDLKKLIKYLKERFGAARIFYYAGVDNSNQIQLELYHKMKQWGFETRLNPVKTFVNVRGKTYQKADVDARMAFEAMKYKDDYDRAVFLTGDGDFYWLLKHLRKEKDRVWLFSSPAKTARELKRLFKGDFNSLDDTRKWLEFDGANKKEADPTNVSASDITPPLYQRARDLSSDRITYEEVTAIEKTGRKEVFDIEVEGTHNFVGNGIVAHNTSGILMRAGASSLQLSSSAASTTADIELAAADRIDLFASSLSLQTSSASAGELRLISAGSLILDTSQNNSNIVFNTGTGGITQNLGTYTVNAATDQIGAIALNATRGGITLSSSMASSNGNIYLKSAGTLQLDTSAKNANILLLPGTGNVGIGTTGPLGILDVLGSCVTGDTRLRRRRRRKGKKSQEEIDLIDLIDLISKKAPSTNDQKRIKELAVKLGFGKLDIGHSLGQLEIRAIRNFAVDQLEQLEIRNSDFEDVRIDQIQEGDEILTLDEKSGRFITQRVSKLMDKGIKNIYKLTTESGKSIRTTGNHPYLVKIATKKSAEADLVHLTDSPKDWSKNLEATITNTNQVVNRGVDLPGVEPGRLGFLDQSSGPARPTPKPLSQEETNRARWIKVNYLSIDDEIATIDGWQKIKSIEQLKAEQVYDIEVAGTHNFVANGIVAHNTSGILMRAGASSLQLSSSATSTTADIELAAADQMDLFAGRFSLTTSSLTGGVMNLSSTGTMTLTTSQTNANILLLPGTGNVGVGTTAPAAFFQIGSGATPAFVATSAGNIGIGTTSPGGIMDILGSCVTGDSLLKRRRRRRRRNGQWEEIWEDIRIDEIKEGDEIMSLDEKTGEFVISKVKNLMNMGVKKVIKLITEDEKEIKTTAKHPYLTQVPMGNGKFFGLDYAFVDEVGVSFSPDQPLFGTGAFVINDTISINKELHDVLTGALSFYKIESKRPGRFEFKFNAIKKKNVHFFKKILDILDKYDWNFWYVLEDKPAVYWNLQSNYIWERYNNILKRIAGNFGRQTAIVADYFDEPGKAKSDLRQLSKVSNVCNIMQAESHGSLLLQVVDILLGAVNFAAKFELSPDLPRHKEKKEISDLVIKILEKKKKRGYKLSSCLSKNNVITGEGPCQEVSNLSTQIETKWVKVNKLEAGMKIATLGPDDQLSWQKIKSIAKMSEEQVYDLQIANTHNFVANGIVAHNTSGILMRAGASSLQLSSSATSTTADIELAAADQMDLFAGRFSLTTSSLTGGVMNLSSTGTMTLTTSQTNANILLLPGTGNVGIGTTGPSALLEVSKSQNARTSIKVTDALAGASSRATFDAQSDLNSLSFQMESSTFNPGAGYELLAADSGVLVTGGANGLRLVSAAAAPIVFGTGGYATANERMRITSSGNVGIGTTSPSKNLEVYGSTNGETAAMVNNPNAGAAAASVLNLQGDTSVGQLVYESSAYSGSYGTIASALNIINRANAPIIFKTNGYGDAAARMTILGNGNVGVGTTDPLGGGILGSTKLTINQSDGSTAFALINGASRRLAINPQTSGGFTIYDGGSGSGWTAGISQVTGNVGIGTTNPLSKLEVNGVGSFSLGSVSAPGISFNGDLNTGMWSSAADTLNFSTGGSERVRINSSGNVGIGTTAPGIIGSGRTLTITDATTRPNLEFSEPQDNIGNGDTVASIRSFIGTANTQVAAWEVVSEGTSEDAAGFRYWTKPAGGAIAERLRITSSGNIGIGTTGPTQLLSLDNASNDLNIKLHRVTSGTSSYIGTSPTGIDISHNAYFNGTNYIPDNTSVGANNIHLDRSYMSFNYQSTATNPISWTEVMRITNGNVGIGTTGPTAKLQIVNQGLSEATNIAGSLTGLLLQSQTTNARAILAFAPNGTSRLADFWLYNTSDVATNFERIVMGYSGTDNVFQIGTSNGGTGTLRNLVLDATGASNTGTGMKQLVLATSGNVGIGTTGPSSLLHLSATTPVLRLDSASGGSTLTFGRSGGTTYDASIKSGVYNGSDLVFYDGATPRMTISNSGGLAFGSGYASTDPGDGNVIIAGNVGIGTTGPLGILDVLGSCVTGDTRLRRRRRRKGKKSQEEIDLIDLIDLISKKAPSTNDQKRIKELAVKLGFGKLDIGHSLGQLEIRAIRNFAVDQLEQLEIRNSDFEDVRIDQIQEGDEILTLDEKSGRFITQRVSKLMDKGIKQTHILVTSGGKSIRTTANHPYLTRPLKSESLIIGGTYQIDQSPRLETLTQNSFIAIANKHIKYVAKLSKKDKKYLKALYNKTGQSRQYGVEVFSYAVAQLINKFRIRNAKIIIDLEYSGHEDRIRQILGHSTLNIDITFKSEGHNRKSYAHIAAYNAYQGKEKEDAEIKYDRGALKGVGLGIVTSMPLNRTGDTRGQLNAVYQPVLELSSGDAKWRKVYELKPGMQVATADGWETIIALKKFSQEQVYDIEVEGTHNFVANGIVAHNTSGILMRAGASSLQLSSSATSTTADIELAAADQMDLFAGRFSLTTSSLTGGVMNLSSTGTMTLTTSQTNANILLLPGTGNVGIGTAGPRANLDVLSGTANTAGEAIYQGLFTGPTRTFSTDATAILTIQSNDAMAANKGGSIAFGGRAITASTAGANWAGISGFKETGTSANYGGYLALYTRKESDGTLGERVRIDSSGNVGIGTTGPGDKLDINSGNILIDYGYYLGVSASDRFFIDGTDGASMVSSVNPYVIMDSDNNATTNYFSILKDAQTRSTATELFRVQENGNVGIGTESPLLKLHVESTSDATIFSKITSTNKFIRLDMNSSNEPYLQMRNSAAVSTLISSNGSSYLMGGNVGIGTTGPGAKLQVQSDTTHTSILLNQNNATRYYNGLRLDRQGTENWFIGMSSSEYNNDNFIFRRSGTTNVMVIDTNGNVGIGTTGPAQALDVNGVIQAASKFKFATGAYDYIIMAGGSMFFTVGGDKVQITSSDVQIRDVLTVQGTGNTTIAGNVGIGTTGPLGIFDVLGSCVTGDTLLPIRRRCRTRRRQDYGGQGKNDPPDDWEWEYLYSRIDQVLPEDEVLSLNEATGTLEYAKINKLVDMGVKEVYELVTKSGRIIRTTAAHPYLTLAN